MNSRERLKMTINHVKPDKIPVDLGATSVSGILAMSLWQLRKALGLTQKRIKICDPLQMTGLVEEDVMEKMGIDIIGIRSPVTIFGYRNENWKEWVLPDGTPALVGQGFITSEDEDGNIYIHPQGDLLSSPSGKLPYGGYYFDNIVRQNDINEEKLHAREDFKEQFTLFSDLDLKYFEDTSNRLYKETEYAIVGNFCKAGLGDAAHIPGPGLKFTPGIRSIEEWYMAHLLYPQYIKEVYEFQIETALVNLKLYKQAVGERIQVIDVSNTDFGMQSGELMSADMFREFYKPLYRKVNDWIHENTTWKTFYHSCGSIINLLDDFVDMGVDILNPVQCSAEGMKPEILKKRYGDRLVFWGGGIDTQKTLPFGSVDEVRKEVRNRLEIFSEGGGYVFNAIHNIQAKTPVENILAMLDEVREFNSKQ